MKRDGSPVPLLRLLRRRRLTYRGFVNVADRGARLAVDALYDALTALGTEDDETVAVGARDRVVFTNGIEDEWWTVASLSVGPTQVTIDHPFGRVVCDAAVALLAAWGGGADTLAPTDRIAAESRLRFVWRTATTGG